MGGASIMQPSRALKSYLLLGNSEIILIPELGGP